MSDDLREREPLRDEGDSPPEEGIRSDHAGTGTGTMGPAPAGGDPERIVEGPAGGDESTAQPGATAAGGYGSASERPSSGGTREGTTTSDDDPQTEWLRRAHGGGAGDSEQR